MTALPKEIEEALYDFARAVEDTMSDFAGNADRKYRDECRDTLVAAIARALSAAEERGARDALLSAARDVPGWWINALAFEAWLNERATPVEERRDG